MPTSTVLTTKVNIQDCIDCGGPIALTEAMERTLRNNHKNFYCPLGHSQAYVGKSDKERIKELEEELNTSWKWSQRMQDDLAAARKAHGTTKGQLTKTRKRIQNGVCPHCHRTFQNVARHMKSKHPTG